MGSPQTTGRVENRPILVDYVSFVPTLPKRTSYPVDKLTTHAQPTILKNTFTVYDLSYLLTFHTPYYYDY